VKEPTKKEPLAFRRVHPRLRAGSFAAEEGRCADGKRSALCSTIRRRI
jgi:hypothetical protein